MEAKETAVVLKTTSLVAAILAIAAFVIWLASPSLRLLIEVAWIAFGTAAAGAVVGGLAWRASRKTELVRCAWVSLFAVVLNIGFAAAFLWFLTVGLALPQKHSAPSAGDPVPQVDAVLETTTGEMLDVASLREPTVLLFYRGHW